MKKSIWYILIVAVVCFLSILSLQLIRQQPEPENGFNRKIKQQILEIKQVHPLPSPAMYFIGNSPSEKELYLKDFYHLSSIYLINYDLSFLINKPLNLPKDSVFSENKTTVGVNGPYMHISNNQTGSLSVFNTNTGNRSNHRLPGISWMDQVNMLSEQSIYSRTLALDGKRFKRHLVKFNYPLNKIDREFLIKRKIDGNFCTDGLLKLDAKSAKLFYMYFFRGEFICLDTNMNLRYTAKTIDTIKIRPISTATISKFIGKNHSTSTKLDKPITPVNRIYTLYQNHIYLLSAIKADNENKADFRNNQIVDIYSQNNGNYLYSFYIPNYEGGKAQDLKIKDGFLYAVYKSQVVKFQLKDRLPY